MVGHRACGPSAGLVVVLLLLLASFAPAAAQEASTTRLSSPSTGEVITLGADTEIFRDDFGVAGSWGVTSDEAASIAYADGALRFDFGVAPRWVWTQRAVGAEVAALWVRASLDIAAKGGSAGPMCGVGGSSPAFLFGIVNTEGEWVVGRIDGQDLAVLARGPLPPSIDLAQGGSAIVSLECAMTDATAVRVAVWVDGVNVADVSVPDAMAPFSLAGLFGESYVEGFGVVADDVVVATGATYEPLMRSPQEALPLPPASPTPDGPVPSAAAVPSVAPTVDLLSRVPAAFSANCSAAEADPANGLLAALECAPAGDAGSAAYFRYDSLEALEDTFTAVLAGDSAITEGTDCSVGPALVDYTIGDQPAGRLACYLVDGTAVALWTNVDLLMMAMGVEASGDFGKLFTWWQDAGPLP